MKLNKKKAPSRAASGTKYNSKLGVMKASRPSGIAQHNNYGMPVCASVGGSYGASGLASSGRQYLTFVVQDTSGNWQMVRVNHHCLDTSYEGTVFEESLADEMLEMWKRVVIDNAIPWEASVRPETMRIIKYQTVAQDMTLSLFHDEPTAKEFLKLNAVSKLSDDEARLLGLTHLKAKQRLLNNPDFQKDDARMLKELNLNAYNMTLNSQLRFLNED